MGRLLRAKRRTSEAKTTSAAELPGPQAYKQPRRASSCKALVDDDPAPYSIEIERVFVQEGFLESSSGLVFPFDYHYHSYAEGYALRKRGRRVIPRIVDSGAQSAWRRNSSRERHSFTTSETRCGCMASSIAWLRALHFVRVVATLVRMCFVYRSSAAATRTS